MSWVYAGSSTSSDVVYCPGHQTYEYHDYGSPHYHWYVYLDGSGEQWSQANVQLPYYSGVPRYPVVADRWPGVEMTENCRYCFQRLIATTDRRVDYCPNCGRSQWHRP